MENPKNCDLPSELLMSVIKERSNMLFVCMTVGLVFLASKYRDNVFRGVKQICHSFGHNSDDENKKNKINAKKHKEILLDKIIMVDSLEKCDHAIQNIKKNMTDGILGFDCEWVKEGPVSLIQLATHNGVCALFRLGKIGCIPANLKELLANRRLLKVGVATFEDGKKLTNDFGCQVSGTIDLRNLASRFNLPCPKSLAALCMHYLDMEMDKIMEVRCSDWNADTLTQDQITYAAYDAHASVLIYHQILRQAKQKLTFLDTAVIYIKNFWNEDEDEKYHTLPHGVIDERFSAPWDSGLKTNTVNNKKIQQINQADVEMHVANLTNKQLPTRNKPLYHNCYLQAPDGETLCTCDRKKAEWYVSKQLGKVVLEDPLTVKLNFEPSGRALGQVGQYYTQIKVNQCVVCGASEKFIRKNVVPREYRKYFPLVMKAHQSHDVLLLCPTCHEISNGHDLQLRRKLAEMCNAPLSCQKSRLQSEQNLTWQKYHAAVKVLKYQHKKRTEDDTCIRKRDDCQQITPHMLDVLQKRVNKMPQISYNPVKIQPHGLKVVEYFQRTEGGLVELEKMWRQHFLTTMKPKYLPKLWSVSHNQERLVIRQTQNRIEPEDARVAGLTSTV